MTTAERDAPAADSLTAVHWVGVVAALVSAVAHLRLGVGMFPSGLGISFLLAGAGFLGGVALVVVGRYRRSVYAIGVPFTLVQVGAWYWVNFAAGPKSFPADVGTLGAVDKVAQFVLLGVLALLLGGDR
ncbi:MAG: hypothetical protein V5A44_06450 [Haloarculaceae archaeon]